MDIQGKLAHRDSKHRDKYTGENKQHLEGVETITRTGETDQDVTLQVLLFLHCRNVLLQQGGQIKILYLYNS